MTVKEALIYVYQSMMSFHSRTDSEIPQKEKEAFKLLNETCAKYRWHDLRKYPDDLPEKDGNDESDYVLVIVGNPSWNHWEQAYYHHGKKQWSTYDNNVIAWKHVEPFEEKDDVR